MMLLNLTVQELTLVCECLQITGAKAPPLRYLAEWLEQNPTWDVDPKWAELVRAKVQWYNFVCHRLSIF